MNLGSKSISWYRPFTTSWALSFPHLFISPPTAHHCFFSSKTKVPNKSTQVEKKKRVAERDNGGFLFLSFFLPFFFLFSHSLCMINCFLYLEKAINIAFLLLTPLEILFTGQRAPINQMGRLCGLEEQTSSQRPPWWHAGNLFCIGSVQNFNLFLLFKSYHMIHAFSLEISKWVCLSM